MEHVEHGVALHEDKGIGHALEVLAEESAVIIGPGYMKLLVDHQR